jgi:starch synthase
MKIVHIASEISPIAKVGGLADVVCGLSTATAKSGHDVSVIIPAYTHLKRDFFPKGTSEEYNINKIAQYHVFKKKLGNVTVFGIDLLSPSFTREGIYGGADEIDFFLYFSFAASDFARRLEPDVIHGHDWQASFSIFDLKRHKSKIKSVLTLHNLQYQGKIKIETLLSLGLSFPLPTWMMDPHGHDYANLLKIGIESADRITTVSKSYHDQILEGSCSFGLEQTLLTHRHKFLGILNGIDFDYFDPFHDEKLYERYPKKAFSHTESLKEVKDTNLQKLLEEHEKPFDDRFTLCSITRLADQKAPFLILYAMKKVIELGGRFILVGSLHGSPHDQEIIDILEDYEEHPYVLAELNTNSAMAHRTYASSHALIVPSLFEPCGLTQMIALRYGTIPLVRATGGLKDTIFDIETSDILEENRNGFTFDYPDHGGIDWVVERAFKLYTENQNAYYSLALKNMHEDHSWSKAAEAYLDLYQILNLNN